MKYITPNANNAGIVVQDLQDETLLYNLQTNQAYCLNETAKIVYQYCDGQTSFDELRAKSGKNLPDEVIWLTIEELGKLNLLTERSESGLSRRSLLQKAALSAAVLPIITMLIAPRAIQANSNACINEGGAPNGEIVGTSNQQQERFCGSFSGLCCSDFVLETNCVDLPGGFRNCDCACSDIPPPV